MCWSPQTEGNFIRLIIPELNEERRKDLAKLAASYAENAKIAIRNVRKDGMDKIKKLKSEGISEDDEKFWSEEVQNLTNDFIKQIDEILKIKQDDILKV